MVYKRMILGLIHICIALINLFYVLIFPTKSTADIAFIFYFMFINIQWFVLKGECIVTYVHKLWNDPNYTLGSTYESDDIQGIIVPYLGKTGYTLLLIAACLGFAMNIGIVMNRNGIPLVLNASLIVASLLYICIQYSDLGSDFTTLYSYIYFVLFVYGLIVYVNMLT